MIDIDNFGTELMSVYKNINVEMNEIGLREEQKD
jgi:hypothetical protein